MSSASAPALVPTPPPGADVPRERRIFVNRNLRLDRIEMIGFDMDHTLAVYRQEPTERIGIGATVRKLIDDRGYPPEIARLDYDPSFAIRGLCVDKRNGNILKMDRYGHVGRALHGRRWLGKDDRRLLYRGPPTRARRTHFTWIDSLFALPEATLYATLVDWFDARGGVRPSYERLWDDVRFCIDKAHSDDSIKATLKSTPDAYFERDPDLAHTLHKFRSAGRRLFLLTNSEWEYTDVVMRHLLDGEHAAYPTWRHYFDFIVVASRKPAFFVEAEPFREMDESGRVLGETRAVLRGRLYQGGNLADFEEHAGARGDRILYVGDHIYGDVLRSKRSAAWRTALIVRELEEECRRMDELRDRIELIEDLERQREHLDSGLRYQQGRLKAAQSEHGNDHDARRGEKDKLDQIRAELRGNIARIEALEAEIDRAFHPRWGPVFKEATETSAFGEQVEDYACVYTSRVTNFLACSPVGYLRSPRQYMAHELR